MPSSPPTSANTKARPPRPPRNRRNRLCRAAPLSKKISTALRRPHAQPRKAALAALVLGRSTNISQIKDLLDEEETEFLGNLKARKTEFSDGLNTAGIAAMAGGTTATALERRRNPRFRPQHQPTCPARHPRQYLERQTRQSIAIVASRKCRCRGHALFALGHPPENKIALNKHELFWTARWKFKTKVANCLPYWGAKRGEIIVDFCAGAGGKTLAVGAQMANKGRIYAFDIAEKRLANLKPRMTRAGLTNIHPERISSEHDTRIARLAGKADRVLVDAPAPA